MKKINFKASSKQAGFTLIELIVVIVILGIMAATALPKFVELGAEARIAKMQAAAGAIKSAASMAYAKSAATGTAAYPLTTEIAALVDLGDDYDVTGAPVFKDADVATCLVTYAADGTVDTSALTELNCK